MDACALLGGPKENWPADLKERLAAAKAAGQFLVGVDRGALFMLEMGLAPDLAVGDFDSLKPHELSWVEGVVPDIRYSVPKIGLIPSSCWGLPLKTISLTGSSFMERRAAGWTIH